MPKTLGKLGQKIGMTRIYTEEGAAVGVTVVAAGPCVVLQKKTENKEGYNAIQVGFGPKKEARENKPMAGHFKNAGKGCFYHVKEFRVDNPDDYELGQGPVLGARRFMLLHNTPGIGDVVTLVQNEFGGAGDDGEVRGQRHYHQKAEPEILPAVGPVQASFYLHVQFLLTK